jgi:hypothetical protein
MSKAYSSNLSLTQYEFLSDLIPEGKPGGRKRNDPYYGEAIGLIFDSLKLFKHPLTPTYPYQLLDRLELNVTGVSASLLLGTS